MINLQSHNRADARMHDHQPRKSDSRFDLHGAVFAAEDALRKIVTDRIAELRAGRAASAQGGETRRAETRSGSVHEHPVAAGQAPIPTPTLKREGQTPRTAGIPVQGGDEP